MLYDTYYDIHNLSNSLSKIILNYVIGPICESCDVLCKNKQLPKLK